MSLSLALSSADLATISAVGAAIVPPVVSFLKNEKWSTTVKQGIALGVSVVTTVVGLLVAGAHFSVVNLSSEVGLVYLGSQIVYAGYFRQSVAERKLTAVFHKAPVSSEVPQ